MGKYHTINHSTFNFFCACKTISDGRKAGLTPEEAALFGKDSIGKVVRIRTLLDHILDLTAQRDDAIGWEDLCINNSFFRLSPKNNTQDFGIFGCKTAQDISRAADISFPDSTQKLSRLGSKYFLNGFKKMPDPSLANSGLEAVEFLKPRCLVHQGFRNGWWQ